ncbi:MAG: hypothetical protein JWM68_1093 [Verrucomicrobiales bacterium]|nr:hypothetical protein [Verrucomicrobiales bacterium]
MLQLKVLSGKKAGSEIVVRHFPFRVGRSKENDLVLDDSGVFDRHFKIELRSSSDFFLQAELSTFFAISGQQNVREAILKNADVIEVGQGRILFTLSPTRQSSLNLRENLTWIALALLTLGQVSLIYWLLKS